MVNTLRLSLENHMRDGRASVMGYRCVKRTIKECNIGILINYLITPYQKFYLTEDSLNMTVPTKKEC